MFFEGSFIFLNISNTNKLIEELKEDAVIILNKLYILFHSIGSLHLGEPILGGQIILWKNNPEEYKNQLKLYTKLVTQNREKINEDNDFNKLIKDKCALEKQICNLSVITGIKFITAIYKQLNDETKNLIAKYKINITLYVDYGKIFQGYSYAYESCRFDSIFTSKNIIEARKITVIYYY